MRPGQFGMGLIAAIGLLCASGVRAQTPTSTVFTYQGQLRHNGDPVTAVADFRVYLYETETGGAYVDSITLYGVPVVDGLFTLALDLDVSAIDGDALWLEFEVGVPSGQPPVLLTPRQPIRPTPYALYALNSGSGGCFWSQNGLNIYYSSGNVGVGTDDPDTQFVVERHYDNNIIPMAIFRTTGTNAAGAVRFENGAGNAFNVGITGGNDWALRYNANIGLSGDLLRITPAGNVGIGVIAPASRLTVAGVIESTTGGVKFPDGTLQTTAGGGGGGYWQPSGSNIYFDAGDVGINTTTPGYPLHVYATLDAAIAGENASENTRGEVGSTYGGIFGESTNGTGVVGQATSGTGANYGVRGEAAGSGGYGVYGRASSGSGITFGVYGLSNSASGRGVYGEVTGVGGNGVFGKSVGGAAVYGVATSLTGGVRGVEGYVQSPNGYAIYGYNEAETGNAIAVKGETNHPNGFGGYFVGRGYFSGNVGIGTTSPTASLHVTSGGLWTVYARNTTASGTSRALYGQADSTTNGYGVVGSALSTTGTTYGVFGESFSPSGYAVFGRNEGEVGNSIGVYGETYSSNGRAVYGTGDGTYARGVMGEVTGTAGYGIYGKANGGTGVYGESATGDGVCGFTVEPTKAGVTGVNEAETGSPVGVSGFSYSSSGRGVYGWSDGNYARGVFGEVAGTYGYGVYGLAAGGTGVYGESASGDGISGYAANPAKAGVKGENEADTGSSIGVWGISGSSGGRAVYGSAAGNNARGVMGDVTGTAGYGVWGQAVGGTGVHGEATNGDGVTGWTGNATKAGVKGENEAGTGNAVGVWGISSSSTGYGGYFEGRGYFSSLVGIGTTAPDEMLHVNGRVKIENTVPGDALFVNTPGDGIYVDASGYAFDCLGGTFGVRGRSNNGVGVHAETNGSTTSNPALLVENSNSAGVGIVSTTNSSATNTVITNTGSGDLIKGFAGPNLVFKVTHDGTTHTNVLQINGGSDLAERFDVAENAEAGTVVAIDPDNPGKLRVAVGAYNRRVAGVISGARGLDTGMVLADLPGAENSQPVALSGRVWVKCDASQQGIEPGDLLTTAERPGHAMAVTDHDRAHGAVIGKAMSRLAQGETGMVLVLVNLH